MRKYWPVILLVLVWVAVLSIPRSRDFVRAIRDPWPSKYVNLNDISWGVETPNVNPALKRRLQALLAKHPNDKRVQLVVASLSDSPKPPEALLALGRKYPGDTVILAAQLDALAERVTDNRTQGPLTNPTPGQNKPIEPLTPEVIRMLHAKLRLARVGKALEPDNTYFDWNELYALFALRRDAEAIRVLGQAAKKTSYNAHQEQRVRWGHEVRELERWITPVEASEGWYSESFPQFAKHRQASRLVMEYVIAARARGERDQALQAGHDLMRLGRVMRQKGSTIISFLVAIAIEHIAIYSWQGRNPALPIGRMRVATLNRTDNMAGCASAWGRKALANEVMAEWKVLTKNRALAPKISGLSLEISPLSDSETLGIFALISRAGELLLSGAKWIFPLWVVLAIRLAFVRLPENLDHKRLGRAVVQGGAYFIICLFCLLMADASLGARHNNAMPGNMFLGEVTSNGFDNAATEWVVGFPLAVLALSMLWGAHRWQAQLVEPARSWREEMEIAGTSTNPINIVVGVVFPWLSRISLWLLGLGGLVYCFGFVPVEDLAGQSGILLALGCMMLAALPVIRWFSLPHRRETLIMWGALLRNAALGYLVTGAIMYGLLLVGLAPLLQNWDDQLHAFFRTTEMAQIRAVLRL